MKPIVLFVDDERSVLDSLRLVLRKEPYQVMVADSAEAGMAILEKHGVAVVVSDERMPGVTGAVFLAQVRERFPKTVRIMLTGQATLEAVVHAINEGQIYRYLSKPIKNDDLTTSIRTALQVRAEREAAPAQAPASTPQPAPAPAATAPQPAVADEDLPPSSRELAALEAEHPGITRIELSEGGAIVIEGLDEDFSDVLAAFGPDRVPTHRPPVQRRRRHNLPSSPP